MKYMHCAYVLLVLVLCGPAYSANTAYVTGFLSDNIVKFDLGNGDDEQVVALDSEDRPRGIAVDENNTLFIALRGGTQNILSYSEGSGIASLTQSVGGTGLGMLEIIDGGRIAVAGDTGENIIIYDIDTGDEITSISVTNLGSTISLTSTESYLFTADYFDGEVAKYDYTSEIPSGTTFINTNLDQPSGMTIGHGGQLVISDSGNGLVQTFDIESGAFLGTLIDTDVLPEGILRDVFWSAELDSYFLTKGNALYEISPSGSLLNAYTSTLLSRAYGISIVASGETSLPKDLWRIY